MDCDIIVLVIKMSNKKRIMLVLEYLKENTNYDNGVNAEVLISYLKTKSIDVERKTIYNDVKQLDEMGYSIAKTKTVIILMMKCLKPVS